MPPDIPPKPPRIPPTYCQRVCLIPLGASKAAPRWPKTASRWLKTAFRAARSANTGSDMAESTPACLIYGPHTFMA